MPTFRSILFLAAPCVAACASAPPPTERMASALASVRAARELGAERVPTAQLHVKLADEEIQKARVLAKENENERADTMLQRASADAELALAMAREDGSRTEAERALKEAHDLRNNNQSLQAPQ